MAERLQLSKVIVVIRLMNGLDQIHFLVWVGKLFLNDSFCNICFIAGGKPLMFISRPL